MEKYFLIFLINQGETKSFVEHSNNFWDENIISSNRQTVKMDYVLFVNVIERVFLRKIAEASSKKKYI